MLNYKKYLEASSRHQNSH